MIGSDFEIFLSKDDCPVPAIGFDLPDKGGVPVPLIEADELVGYIHRDNLMVEMNCLVASNAVELATNVSRAMDAGLRWINARSPGHQWYDSAAADFLPHHCDSYEGRELGCDKDYVVGGFLSVARSGLQARDLGSTRYAGGHLHFSWPDPALPPFVGAILCDLFIGLPERGHLNARRANVYGNVTLHRPTQYPDGSRGVEYRPLDSFWVLNEEARRRVAKGAELVHSLLHEANYDLLHELVTLHGRFFKPTDLLTGTRDGVANKVQRLAEEICGRYHA